MSSPINLDVDQAAACAFECAEQLRTKSALSGRERYQYTISKLYQFLTAEDGVADIHCRMAALRNATRYSVSVSGQGFDVSYSRDKLPKEERGAYLLRTLLERANLHVQDMNTLIEQGSLGPDTFPATPSRSSNQKELLARRNLMFKY